MSVLILLSGAPIFIVPRSKFLVWVHLLLFEQNRYGLMKRLGTRT